MKRFLDDRPSAEEVEAYYLSGSLMNPERFAKVKEYVETHYLDGGTRDQFLAQRKRVEAAIAASI